MQSFNNVLQIAPSPKSLSNEALLRNTQTLVAEERKLTTSILWNLHEIQVRRLYAEKGYRSLFEYAVQELGYSEAAAGRRISAMRLLADVPEIEPVLQKGSVSLSTLSTIQSFIQRKKKPVSKTEKKELVLALEGKSRRECEKHLIALDPLAATPKEKERVVSPTQTEIRFIADDALMEMLQKIKDLDAHFQSNPSYLELFRRMAKLALSKLDPAQGSRKSVTSESKDVNEPKVATANASTPSTSDTTSKASMFDIKDKPLMTPPAELKKTANPRYISAATRREVWRRDQGQCSYKSPDGKRCSSRFSLQIDHITPVAWNGKSELSNLQLLCRDHNRYKAVAQLGGAVMQRYLRQ